MNQLFSYIYAVYDHRGSRIAASHGEVEYTAEVMSRLAQDLDKFQKMTTIDVVTVTMVRKLK